jgi:AraC-like DNA-binding protein
VAEKPKSCWIFGSTVMTEARRLMLSEDLDAASAAYRVGYQDASYFNREYKSLFGIPPMRDVQRLRGETLSSAGR